MADYAIGDVQGCFNELLKLLKKIKFSSDKDKLFFLGDVVNRGPKSLETLRFIKDLQDNAEVVLGNHDFHLLACALRAKEPSTKDTFGSILRAADKHKLIDFLLSKPLVIEYKKALMVHAGIPPNWDAELALSQSQLIQRQLRTTNVKDFIMKMYGDKITKYNQNMSNLDNCRYSINALTRMRFCTADGKLDLSHKENHDKAPKGCLAWFLHDNRKLRNTDIFFGHWSTLANIEHPHIYPMDSGCVWGGKLSAINITNKQIISVN